MSERPPVAKPSPDDLAQLAILQGVALPAMQDLLAECELRQLAAGEVLLTLGQPNRVMYMVLAGRLSVHLESPQSEAVAFLAAGETVGELSVMDQSPASAFVVAAEPTSLLAVDETGFWNLVNASHDFAINLLLLFTLRLRKNNSTVQTNIRLQREYKRNAMVDGLTGLFNRRWLDDALPRFVSRATRSSAPLSVVMLDVDHFKRFNDTYGHAAGDQVLSHLAHVLRQNLRPTDLAARYGGEEFLVIFPETDVAGATLAADRLRLAVSAAPLAMPDGTPLPTVTISLGGKSLALGETMAELLGAADAALYQSKRGGRNRVTWG